MKYAWKSNIYLYVYFKLSYKYYKLVFLIVIIFCSTKLLSIWSNKKMLYSRISNWINITKFNPWHWEYKSFFQYVYYILINVNFVSYFISNSVYIYQLIIKQNIFYLNIFFLKYKNKSLEDNVYHLFCTPSTLISFY